MPSYLVDKEINILEWESFYNIKLDVNINLENFLLPVIIKEGSDQGLQRTNPKLYTSVITVMEFHREASEIQCIFAP